ncbi:unnamed protein product [marine sediment metagenome]|uniref:Uncharacterized protein n=1 Tax=marine sediment metagenome TaxID=412755 RepID=X0Y7T5_9ZZZZ
MAEWIIVSIAVLGLVFNSGILYNDVKHLKKSMDNIWLEINKIKEHLLKEDK